MGALTGCLSRGEVLKRHLDDPISAADFGHLVAGKALKACGPPGRRVRRSGLDADELLVIHYLMRDREIDAAGASRICRRPMEVASEKLLDVGGCGCATYYHLSRAAYGEVLDNLHCPDPHTRSAGFADVAYSMRIGHTGRAPSPHVPISTEPGKVEQRTGGVDRTAQKLPTVKVVNLFLHDTVDQSVYEILRSRCGLFEHFVGATQPVFARARRMPLGKEPLDCSVPDTVTREVEP